MKKNFKSIVLIFVILVVLALAYFMFFNGNNSSVEVSVVSAMGGSISKSLDLTGVLYSTDFEEISITPNLEVLKIYVEENSIVKSGQLLAELDSNDLLISLKKNEISLEQLDSDLADAKGRSGNYEAVILKNKISKSQEEYNKIKENLDESVENVEKGKVLYEENVISKTEYEKYISSSRDLESNLKIAELNYNDAVASYNDYNNSNKQDIVTIERQIKSLILDIERLNNEIDKTKIYSSINGVLTEFPLKESRKTVSGSKIIIYDTSSYEFEAKVTQEDAVFIKEGQLAKVSINGIPNSYDGIVSYLGKTADIDENSGSKTPKVEVKIILNNIDSLLKSGYEGEAVIEVDKSENVITVKNECIKQDDENKKYLFVLENNVAKKVYVETGLSDGYNVVVLSGIKENDKVVINPQIDLFNGEMVKILN